MRRIEQFAQGHMRAPRERARLIAKLRSDLAWRLEYLLMTGQGPSLFRPDDAQLTAYAEGALDPSEEAFVESYVARNPEVAQAVDAAKTASGGMLAHTPAAASSSPGTQDTWQLLWSHREGFAVRRGNTVCCVQFKWVRLNSGWRARQERSLGAGPIETPMVSPPQEGARAATGPPTAGGITVERTIGEPGGPTFRLALHLGPAEEHDGELWWPCTSVELCLQSEAAEVCSASLSIESEGRSCGSVQLVEMAGPYVLPAQEQGNPSVWLPTGGADVVVEIECKDGASVRGCSKLEVERNSDS